MNSLRFDAAILEARLARLDIPHRICFAASCSERLLPNYASFSRGESWGDVETLRKALDHVWQCVEDQRFDRMDWKEIILECEPLLPDTEDFQNPLVSAALDAGTALLSTLRCCEDGSPKHAVEAATYARDTVYMSVENDSPEAHSLMNRELERQEVDLKTLEAQCELRTAVVMQIRYTSQTKK